MLYRLKGLGFVTEEERSSLAEQDSAGLSKASGIPGSSGTGRRRWRDAGPCQVRGDGDRGIHAGQDHGTEAR